jgi:hypothetical protein
MKLYHERCAGLDVHSNLIVACARIAVLGGEVSLATRSFSTNMKALTALSDWLSELGVTHVVMESTGVYWKPVTTRLGWRSWRRMASFEAASYPPPRSRSCVT